MPENGLIVILVFVFVAVISSLIPALMSKLLMSGVFKRRVSYGMVLFGTTLGILLLIAAGFLLGVTDEAEIENLPALQASLASLAAFLFQALVLSFTAPDENLELIAFWKWVVVLILQYVLFIVLAMALGLLIGASGIEVEANLIQTRMV